MIELFIAFLAGLLVGAISMFFLIAWLIGGEK